MCVCMRAHAQLSDDVNGLSSWAALFLHPPPVCVIVFLLLSSPCTFSLYTTSIHPTTSPFLPPPFSLVIHTVNTSPDGRSSVALLRHSDHSRTSHTLTLTHTHMHTCVQPTPAPKKIFLNTVLQPFTSFIDCTHTLTYAHSHNTNWTNRPYEPIFRCFVYSDICRISWLK